jgi:hypothetical protein
MKDTTLHIEIYLLISCSVAQLKIAGININASYIQDWQTKLFLEAHINCRPIIHVVSPPIVTQTPLINNQIITIIRQFFLRIELTLSHQNCQAPEWGISQSVSYKLRIYFSLLAYSNWPANWLN